MDYLLFFGSLILKRDRSNASRLWLSKVQTRVDFSMSICHMVIPPSKNWKVSKFSFKYQNLVLHSDFSQLCLKEGNLLTPSAKRLSSISSVIRWNKDSEEVKLMWTLPSHYIELAVEIIEFPISYRLKLINYALRVQYIWWTLKHLTVFWGRLTVGVTPAPQIFTQSFFEKKTPRKEERFQQLGNYMKKWRKRVQNRWKIRKRWKFWPLTRNLRISCWAQSSQKIVLYKTWKKLKRQVWHKSGVQILKS